MDTIPHSDGDTPDPRPEAEAERRARLAWEAEMIAEADAEIEAGLYVDPADMKAWIDSIGTDHQFPLPSTRHR